MCSEITEVGYRFEGPINKVFKRLRSLMSKIVRIRGGGGGGGLAHYFSILNHFQPFFGHFSYFLQI